MIIKPQEKRHFARVEIRTGLRYQVRGSASEFGNVVSNNVSMGGVGLGSNRFLAPSTALNLEIDVLSKVIHPIGKVAWCCPLPHSNSNSLGIEFIEFNAIEKGYLEDFIKMQTDQL